MVKMSSSFILLFRELLRTLKLNWKQYVSVVVISFLSICLFTGLTSNANNLKERQDILYNSSNFADVYVTTSYLEKDDLEMISNLNQIKEYEQRIYLPNSNSFSTKSGYLIGVADNYQLTKATIIDGQDGFLVTDSFLEQKLNNKKLKIGDELSLTFNNFFANYFKKITINDFINNKFNFLPESLKNLSLFDFLSLFAKKDNILAKDNIDLTFKITGTMYHPEGVQSASFSSPIMQANYSTLADAIYTLFDNNYNLSFIDKYVNFKSLIKDNLSKFSNQVLIKTDYKEQVISDINSYFSSKENSNLIIVNSKESLASYQALKQDVNQSMQLTFVFPVIFFLVSILVILTTLSQMIIKSRSQIGILKCLGVKKSQIYFHYISYGVVLCLLGGLLGFIVGPLIIPAVMGIKYNLLWDLPKLKVHFFYPLSILIFIILLLLAGLCSFLVSYNVIKVKPVDTLNVKIDRKQGKNINANSFFYKHSSISLKMAIRNIFKNKGKSLMVVLGMLGCTALMVSGFGINDTLNYDVNLDFNVNRNIDILISGNNLTEENSQKISELDNVKRVELVSSYPVSISFSSSIDTSLTILEKDSLAFKVPYYVNDGITIDKNSAERINVKLGDNLKVYLNGQIYLREVTYIFTSSVLHGIFDLANPYTQKFTPTSIYVSLNDSSKADEVKNEIEKLKLFDQISTHKELEKQANNLLSSISKMTDVIKVFAILLCMVVIYNLTSLNISERNRDISTLKVLGFSFKDISKTLTYEIALNTFIGSILGLILGYPLTILIMVVNKTDLLTFVYHINWYTYLIAFIISYITSIVVSMILNLKIKKIDMIAALKSVE